MTDQNDRAQQNGQEGWSDCPSGILTGYSRRIRRRHLLLLAAKTVGATGCVAAIGLGAWMEYLRRLERGYQFAGITCSEVRESLADYLDGRLETARADMLEKHVMKCSACAALRPRMKVKGV